MYVEISKLEEILAENIFQDLKSSLKLQARSKTVDLFALITRLNALDLAMLLLEINLPKTSTLLLKYWTNAFYSKDHVIVEFNFDAFLPFNEKRDYLIKKLVKLELEKTSIEDMTKFMDR